MSSPNSPLGSQAPRILRARKPGLNVTELEQQGGVREFHLSLTPLPGESFPAMLQRVEIVLRESEARVIKLDIFGPVGLYSDTVECIAKTLGKLHGAPSARSLPWPITWTDGSGCGESPIGGIQVTAVAGTPVEPVRLEDRVIGSIYQDSFARHYVLGDLRPAQTTGSRSQQTSQTYEQLETALGLKGMSMCNVVRTWFFLDDILSWYDDFNHVRTTFYQERKLIERFVPASTGVGIKNPFGTAVVLGAWAIEPLNEGLSMNMLPSPLQCPAPAYGSCFSRAAEIVTPGYRRVMVSGTASIHPPGDSAHAGDMTKQVDLTMKVIEAILGTRELSFADTTRATAYIKNPSDAAVLVKWCEQNKARFPVTVVHADICRTELLFELELDAMGSK